MNKKCDRCECDFGHVKKQPIFFGTWKIPETYEKVYLCDGCFAEWNRLWAKNLSIDVVHSIPNCKKILALWKQFFGRIIKEKVLFT